MEAMCHLPIDPQHFDEHADITRAGSDLLDDITPLLNDWMLRSVVTEIASPVGVVSRGRGAVTTSVAAAVFFVSSSIACFSSSAA